MKYEEALDMKTLLVWNMSQQRVVDFILSHSQKSAHSNTVGGLAPFPTSNSTFPLKWFLVKNEIILRQDKKPALNLF